MDMFSTISEKRKSELREKTKNLQLPIPPEVSCRKEILPNGQVGYIFRHEELGDVGRLFILPNSGESQFIYEVTGDEDDPMTAQRKAVFEPITRAISAQMISILGKGKGKVVKPYKMPPQTLTLKIIDPLFAKKADPPRS